MLTISSNKVIAKNTFLLYIRMIVLMGLNLYISRIVLQYLGVSDFGLYGVVGSVVVLFSFLNTTMSDATSRFLSYSIGKGLNKDISNVFNASLNIHIILILIIIVLAETIGLYVVNNVLDIPADRMKAANWAYQLSILTFCANIIRVPFNAAIISYEKMSFYAYLSIADVVIKLTLLFSLFLFNSDRLVLYSLMIFISTPLITFCYYLYYKIKLPAIRYNFSKRKECKYKEMLSFSGWTLFAGVANVGSNTGLNMLLNVYYGLAVNASVGIANQVSNALYSLVSNFQTAFKPSLTKLYATEEKTKLFKLVFQSSKFSYYLFWIITLPIMVAIDPILQLWLDTVPNKAASFTILITIYLLIDALFLPVWEMINATGKVRIHQLTCGLLILSNFPLAWSMLVLGMSAESVWYGRIALNIVANIFRLLYVIKLVEFPSVQYCKDVIFRIVFISTLTLIINIYFYSQLPNGSIFLLIYVCLSCITSTTIVYYWGVTKSERNFIFNIIRNRIDKTSK